jgi:hypothetical protein
MNTEPRAACGTCGDRGIVTDWKGRPCECPLCMPGRRAALKAALSERLASTFDIPPELLAD